MYSHLRSLFSYEVTKKDGIFLRRCIVTVLLWRDLLHNYYYVKEEKFAKFKIGD